MSFGSSFVFTLLTNDPCVARKADRAGVNIIGLDFEQIGKRDRQPEKSAWISNHKFEELPAVRKAIKKGRLFARVNPLYENTKIEVDQLINYGVDVLMLPFFHTAKEVEDFVGIVNERAAIVALVETPEALEDIQELCEINEIEEITIGLNDLHRLLGHKSHFEILVSDKFSTVAKTILSSNKRLGIGTLGRIGDNNLPIPSDLICAQYVRLGAMGTRLFRFFLGSSPRNLDFNLEIYALRDRLDYWNKQSPYKLEAEKKKLQVLLNTTPNDV